MISAMQRNLGKQALQQDDGFARSLLPIHTIRVLVYQLVIVTCQYAAGLGIFVLLAIEVGKFSWSIKLRKQGILKNKILVLAEGNQSAFMIVFLIISGMIHQLTMKEKVPDLY